MRLTEKWICDLPSIQFERGRLDRWHRESRTLRDKLLHLLCQETYSLPHQEHEGDFVCCETGAKAT